MLRRAGLSGGAGRQVRTWNLSRSGGCRSRAGRRGSRWCRRSSGTRASAAAAPGRTGAAAPRHDGPRSCRRGAGRGPLRRAAPCSRHGRPAGRAAGGGRRGESCSRWGCPTGAAGLTAAHRRGVERAAESSARVAGTLDAFVDGLASGSRRSRACGLPDTLVHGDFHPGNMRGTTCRLSCSTGATAASATRCSTCRRSSSGPGRRRGAGPRAWIARGGRGSRRDPERARRCSRPVAAARRAVVYQRSSTASSPSSGGTTTPTRGSGSGGAPRSSRMSARRARGKRTFELKSRWRERGAAREGRPAMYTRVGARRPSSRRSRPSPRGPPRTCRGRPGG